VTATPEIVMVLGALGIDAFFREPRDAFHPVAYLGRAISGALRFAPAHGRVAQLAFGAALAVGLPALVAILVAASLSMIEAPVAYTLVGMLALKSTFALRALGDAGLNVASALEREGVEPARPRLRSLCSRDPSSLDEDELAAAAVESLSENLSDSVIAPLFYFALFGIPGAVAYRVVNTLDAMVGYHGRFEYLGKASARLDDALNIVPARITALLLLVAGALLGKPLRRGLAVLLRDGGKTESPNAGRPMATVAGLLGVALEKPGHYRLFAEGAVATPATIREANQLVRATAYLGAAVLLLVLSVPHG
jgi:adenosylcobinamide-phosphate synthase